MFSSYLTGAIASLGFIQIFYAYDYFYETTELSNNYVLLDTEKEEKDIVSNFIFYLSLYIFIIKSPSITYKILYELYLFMKYICKYPVYKDEIQVYNNLKYDISTLDRKFDSIITKLENVIENYD